ncbi:MAG: hypothetical protein LBB09_03840, partial [Rickettsiales bacterium]|nr:hypothetical protein [Rickettsiales bacterium]
NDDDDDVHKPKKLLRNSIVIPPKGPPIKPPKKQPENPIVILPPPIKPPVLNIKLPKEPPINPSKKPTNSLLNLVIKKKIEVGKQQPYNDDNIVDYTDDNGDDYLDTSIERNDDLKKEKSEGRPPYVILGNIIYAQFKKESILTERTKNSHHIPVKLFLNSFESIKIYYLSGNGNDNKKIRDFLKSIFRMFNSVFKKNENIPENQSDSLNKIFNILLLICYCEQNFELSEDNELQKLKKDAKNELCNLANEFDNEKSAAKEETEKIGKNDTRTPLNFLERKNNDAKFNEKMKELDEGMENIIKKGKEKNPALNNVGKEFVDSKKKLKWSKKCFGLWEPLVKNNNAYNNSGAVNFLRYKLFAIEIGDDLPEEYKNMIVKNNTLTKDNKYLVSLPQFIALSVVLSENGRDKGEIIKDIIKNSSEALKYSEENEENIRQALSLLLAMYESLEPQKEEKSDVKDEILKTLADTLPQDKAKEITNFGNNDCLREGIEKESRENKEEIEEEEEENEEGGKNENEKLNEIGLAIKESSKSSDKMNHDPNRLTK